MFSFLGYVTISRGRRGIRIFTPDKIQLRENLIRSGHRPLAIEFAGGAVRQHRGFVWHQLHRHLLRFGRRAADLFCWMKQSQHHQQLHEKHERQISRMLHH